MDDKKLQKISTGLYIDDKRALYFKVRELLAAHGIADTPEVRKAIRQQIRQDFGVIEITELPDE